MLNDFLSQAQKTNTMVELTGQPCSGKSFILKKILKQRPIEKHYLNALDLLRLKNIKFRELRFLVTYSKRSKRRLIQKLRALISCITKLLYSSKYKYNFTIIDEGVSHIPYLLDLKGNDLNQFLEIFASHFEKTLVLYCVASQDNIRKRLIKRGHKRIKPDDKNALNNFLSLNNEIDKSYQQILFKSRYMNYSKLSTDY